MSLYSRFLSVCPKIFNVVSKMLILLYMYKDDIYCNCNFCFSLLNWSIFFFDKIVMHIVHSANENGVGVGVRVGRHVLEVLK